MFLADILPISLVRCLVKKFVARFTPRLQEMGGKLVFSSLLTRGSQLGVDLVSLRVQPADWPIKPLFEPFCSHSSTVKTYTCRRCPLASHTQPAPPRNRVEQTGD